MHRALRHVMLAGLIAALTLLPTRAEAVELRSGALVTVRPGEQIDDDLYFTGGEVSISGTVNGDVIVAAQNVFVDGVVNGNLVVIAASLSVTGKVRDNVRALAGQVRVSGAIGHDLLAAAGNADLQPVSSIGRDVYLAMGSGNVAGTVGRDVKAAGSQVGLNASVGRAVDLIADTITVGSNARVAGDFSYRSERHAQIASGAQISGAVTQVQPEPRRQPSFGEVALTAVMDRLRGLVTPLVLGLIGLWLLPRTTSGITSVVRRRPFVSAGAGLGFLVVVPVVGVFLTVVGVLLGGFALGLLLLTASWTLVVLSRALVGLALGEVMLERVAPDRVKERGWALVAGLVVLAALSLLPFVDLVMNVVIACLGSGALLLWAAETYRAVRAPSAMAPSPAATAG